MPNRLTKKFIKQVFINVKAGDVDVVARINNLTIRNQISLLKARDEFGWSILH
jgi:hypothetical protein